MYKLISTLIIALFITGCSSEENETNQDKSIQEALEVAKGGTYRQASIGEASNLIPWTSSDQPSHEISGHIYNGLLKYDRNLNLVGDLADSWDITEDGLNITFYLRKGVKWADGTELTTKDVLASFNTITDPNTLTPYAGDYLSVSKAEAIDDYTFKVSYDEPFAPSLSSWTLKILPKLRLDAEDINNSSLKTDPMGTGMYTLDKWQRGEYIQLKASKTHFKREANLTKMVTRLIPDTDTQFLELKAGNIDIMGLKPLQFTRLTNAKSFTNTYDKYKYLSNGYTYMGFKLDHPLFTDKRVRQALSHAISRDEIVAGVLLGQGVPLACPFKPGTWAYNENIKPYVQNVEKSKALLAQAGWTDTDDDGLLDKVINGQKHQFEFTVVTNQGNDMRKMTAELMQQAFSKIGVKMNINVQEWSTFIQNTINKRQFDAFILGWSLSPEPDPYDIFHSSKTGEKEFNIVGFNNKEADEMMVNARRTFDQDERKKYLNRFQEILNDEQPYLFLYAPYSLLAIQKRIHNVEANELGMGDNFIDWFIPESLQTKASIAPK